MEVTAEDLRGQGCLVPTPLSHFLPVGGVRGYVNHLVLHLLPTENCLDVVLLRVQLQRVKSNIHHSLDVVLLRVQLQRVKSNIHHSLDVVLLRVQLQRVKSNIHHSLDVVLLRTHATNRACVCESVCVRACVRVCVVHSCCMR